LNQSQWSEAEDELADYAERTGSEGALMAVWMQALLASRQGRSRLAQGLFLHLADLERAAHEPLNEAQYLFWSIDVQKMQEKSDRSVAFGSERLQKRLWQLTDRLPLECYRRGLSSGQPCSDSDMAFLAASLLSLLREQDGSQDLLGVFQEISRKQPTARLRCLFLQRGLLGTRPRDSLSELKFRQWCWNELYGLLDQLDEDKQLQATLTLSYSPPLQAPLAAVLERGLELTRRHREVQEREQNWDRYGRICQARSTLLAASGRLSEAVDCLLEAERKLVSVHQVARLNSVLESLMWMQSRVGQEKESEATALRLLETVGREGAAGRIVAALGVLPAREPAGVGPAGLCSGPG